MSTAAYNQLDVIQQAFARSVLDLYVAAYHGQHPGPVVLSGAGGTGKTTSVTGALEIVRQWLQQRYDGLRARQRAEDAEMSADAARQMAREAPSDQARNIFREIAVQSAAVKRESADDRKDRELLEQAEAIAFAVIEETINADF